MRAPIWHCLVVSALTFSRAFAASGEPSAGAGLLVDSDGQPVRSSTGDCWRNSAGASDIEARCPRPSRAVAPLALIAAKQATATQAAPPLPTTAFMPAHARGNPGYLTDSTGWVVRSSRGECWRTGSWTPELASVIGCDSVLAKAVPVPAPAPSPRPQPPAAQPESPAQAPAGVTEARPTTTPMAPPAVPPSTPPAAVAPAAPDAPPSAAPQRERQTPPVVPPAPPTATPSGIAPPGEARESGAVAPGRVGPVSEKVTLDTDTYFDFDKASLKREGRRKLDVLAAQIDALKLEVIVATGHADWTGSDRYNQKLSERRALAVKRYLAEKGVPNNRIFTEGKGEKEPLASNATRTGRAQNRRVEVEVVGTRDR